MWQEYLPPAMRGKAAEDFNKSGNTETNNNNNNDFNYNTTTSIISVVRTIKKSPFRPQINSKSINAIATMLVAGPHRGNNCGFPTCNYRHENSQKHGECLAMAPANQRDDSVQFRGGGARATFTNCRTDRHEIANGMHVICNQLGQQCVPNICDSSLV